MYIILSPTWFHLFVYNESVLCQVCQKGEELPQITFVTPAKGNSRAKGNIKTALNLVMLLLYHSFLSFARRRWTIIIVWIYLRMNLSLSLGNINASLMTLRTCMEVLRENQANAENGVSPKVVCFHNIYNTGKWVIYTL